MRKERIVRKELARAPIGSWRGPSPDFLHEAQTGSCVRLSVGKAAPLVVGECGV
jgi:hypothetical protein